MSSTSHTTTGNAPLLSDSLNPTPDSTPLPENRLSEFSTRQSACISLVLLTCFAGFIAAGAAIAYKLSAGNKYSSFAGGIMGMGAFMIVILAGAGPGRREAAPRLSILLPSPAHHHENYGSSINNMGNNAGNTSETAPSFS
jgi:hypothetical protein